MKKLALVAALVAVAIAVPMSIGSSHREAPLTSIDPTGDDTDLYAFTAEDAPGDLTIVSNWVPFEDPAGGPNFYKFDDNAHYYLNIDNTGDGVADLRYEFEFQTETRNPNSFLYAGPGTQNFNDPGLNVVQRYDLTREVMRNGEVTSEKKIARNLPVAPPNIGPKTFPNYAKFAKESIRTLHDGTQVFVGSRDDPFFVDLGAAFDAINVRQGTGNEGQGKDDLSGTDTSATILQIPESRVTKNHQPVAGPGAANAVVGVWSSTERRRLEVQNANSTGGSPSTVGGQPNDFVQVSRLGNPLVNEVIIPLGKKDKFNRTTPDQDAANYGSFVVKPELAATLNALFGVGAPEDNRTDIVQAVLQGIPDLNEHSGPNAGTPVDTLKINLGIPPSPTPSRFGVLGGDNAGYPNGRRLTDDVVDIDLQVVAGFLVGNQVPLGDGVDRNDKPFLDHFPYLAAPHSGFASDPSQRFEPAHPPTPPGGP